MGDTGAWSPARAGSGVYPRGVGRAAGDFQPMRVLQKFKDFLSQAFWKSELVLLSARSLLQPETVKAPRIVATWANGADSRRVPCGCPGRPRGSRLCLPAVVTPFRGCRLGAVAGIWFHPYWEKLPVAAVRLLLLRSPQNEAESLPLVFVAVEETLSGMVLLDFRSLDA